MTRRYLFIIVLDSFRTPDFWDDRRGSGFAPFLSSLLKRGARSLPAVASSSWTLPSHQSLLLGVNPWEVLSERSAATEQSIPFQWSKQGGITKAWSANPVLLGKCSPLAGFDETNNGIGDRRIRFASDLVSLVDVMSVPLEAREVSNARLPGGMGSPSWPTLTSVVHTGMRGLQSCVRLMLDGRHIVAELRKDIRATSRDEPTLVFINFMETHEPYSDGSRNSSRLMQQGIIPSMNLSYHSRLVSRYCSDTTRLHAAYANAITDADNRVRELFAVLEREGLLADSSFVILGDHGQCLGEHHFLGHARYLYDELVHVPCLFWSKEFNRDPGKEVASQDYVDHRHVFRLISGTIRGTLDSESFDSQVQASLETIGPAVSFYKGRPFLPNAMLSREPEYWLLRVISRTGSVQTGSMDALETQHVKSIEPMPDDFVARWTSQTINAIDRNSALSNDGLSVSNRLQAWGYS